MRAAVLREGRLVVDEFPDPVPEEGQLLVRTLACGICGSDLHFLRHGRELISLAAEMGPSLGELPSPWPDLGRDIFMGHEFSAEVLACGKGVQGPGPGSVVVSIPVVASASGIHQLAYGNDFHAGYGEQMLLSAGLALEVPEGLDHRHAALTEPLAVGIHAVARSGAGEGDAALVIGCGPVGLAVIAALSLEGVGPIVATDPSTVRRSLALRMGAEVAVDPADEPGIEAWRRIDGRRPLVVYEAVGVPGMLDSALRDAPPQSRIAVVGVCMEGDNLHPFFGIGKELTVQFAFGYDPIEFTRALSVITEGRVEVGPLITGSVDLEGLPAAFELLTRPDEHAKILLEPG